MRDDAAKHPLTIPPLTLIHDAMNLFEKKRQSSFIDLLRRLAFCV